jgi:hypothetical protein
MPEQMTRAEHLKWAKDRALEYLNPPTLAATESSGSMSETRRIYKTADGRAFENWPPPVSAKQLADACASFLSDLRKHPDIDPSVAEMVFGIEAFTGGLNTPEKVRHFIEGTN